MKILFPIGSFFPSQQGGPCNSVFSLAKALAEKGTDVSVLTSTYDIYDNTISPDQWIERDGIRIFYRTIPVKHSLSFHQLYFRLLPFLISSVIEKEPWDIIHTTTLFTSTAHIGAQWASNKKTPLVISPRGETLQSALDINSLKKKLFLSLPSMKKIMQHAMFHTTSTDEAASVSTMLRNCFHIHKELVADKIFTLPNILSRTDCNKADPPSLPFALPDKYLLFLGRISPIKNIEMILRSFASADITQEIFLVIAGWTGEDKAYTNLLKDLAQKLGIKNRVLFTEKRVEGSTKKLLISHASMLLLASHSENFAMVVVEALQESTPVLAVHSTPWKILEDTHAGYWVTKDDLSFTSALNHFFSQNREKIAEMKTNAFSLSTQFLREHLAEKYITQYQNILERST